MVYKSCQLPVAALPEMRVSRLMDSSSASRTLANMMCFPMPRRREPEWMDQPGLDEAEHHQALSGLSTLHRVRSTVGPLWKVVREVARRQTPVPLSVLDIACGGGDVLVQDLVRSRLGLGLTWIGCHLLSRSPIVRVDGPRSVRAAFTPREVRALAAQAELDAARLSCHWPQRLVLQWRRS